LLASLPEDEREAALRDVPDEYLASFIHDWRGFWARPSQLIPGTPGAASQRQDWVTWLILTGRGWGKTKTGGETIKEWAEKPLDGPIHLIAPTSADIRSVMIEGSSGLMSCYRPGERPLYQPALHKVTWANGNVAYTFSADEPERLRGPQCARFWADEIAAWRFMQEAWDNLQFGFRVGSDPRAVITTTPKPVKLLKEIIANPNTVVTRGSTYENRLNLAPTFFSSIVKRYEGTRLGRQELMAEVLDDVPGALWTRAIIDMNKIHVMEIKWDLIWRVVVAIDPAVTHGEDADETGIVVAGLTRSGHVIVLDDLSCRESPLTWAKIAIAACRTWKADRVIGEVNNGGELVGANLRAVSPDVPFRAVHASRGKAIRAEPVAALYEQGRVHHVRYDDAIQGRADRFELLEDQMCGFVPGLEQKSPDRMDALVWAITELVIEPENLSMLVTTEPYQGIGII